MLERAAQKLRLDQLVIQQGRTQITKGSRQFMLQTVSTRSSYRIVCYTAANKEELLDIIQHGAEKIVNSTEKSVVFLDIRSRIKNLIF